MITAPSSSPLCFAVCSEESKTGGCCFFVVFVCCSGPFGLQPKSNMSYVFVDLDASGQAAQTFTAHECWLEALGGGPRFHPLAICMSALFILLLSCTSFARNQSAVCSLIGRGCC